MTKAEKALIEATLKLRYRITTIIYLNAYCHTAEDVADKILAILPEFVAKKSERRKGK
ncbi:MAG: hypothetical protein IMZ71_00370 [Chloroflexi bacterium]|nr:hypothetical protein [Chloroflexota bacterium]